MAKNAVMPATMRVSSKLLHRDVDYVVSNSTNIQRNESFHKQLLAMLPRRKNARRAGILPQWREGTDMDKAVAASLALWYDRNLQGVPHRLTMNMDHKWKASNFGYLTDQLKRKLKQHGIDCFWVSFEVSNSGWLHAHGMLNIPDGTNPKTVAASLTQMFAKHKVTRQHFIRHRITHSDRVIRSPLNGKGPEQWASYSVGDQEMTRAELGWPRTTFMSQPLKQSAKAVYDWLRKPDPQRLPFELPIKAPSTEKRGWLNAQDGAMVMNAHRITTSRPTSFHHHGRLYAHPERPPFVPIEISHWHRLMLPPKGVPVYAGDAPQLVVSV